MKANMTTPSRVPFRHTAFKAAACVTTLAAMLAFATTVRAQPYYDNFDNGAENPAVGWAHITNPNYPATYTFPTDAFGGHAYELQASPPGSALTDAANETGWDTARVIAVATNHVYTDFYVASDLLNWSTNYYKNTNYTLMGLLARCTSPDITVGSNFNAVALFYWINVDTQEYNNPGDRPSAPGTGILGLGYIMNGLIDFQYPMTPVSGPPGGIVPSSVAEWTLQAGRSYRLVFQGQGRNLTGNVYDTQDLTTPIGTVSGDTSAGDLAPLVFPAPTNGWSGLCGLYFNEHQNVGLVDVTFDNFYADVAPPASVSAPATPIGMIGAPQVVNRTPASWSNFYNPAGGITFTAATLTTTNAINSSAIRLILNGVDVSSSLIKTGNTPTTNVNVSFGLGGSQYSLAPNIVYDASIILQDSYGRSTTNYWTFDTFTDAYLAQNGNIECEDYDIAVEGVPGQSIGFPVPASGFSTNDNTWYTPAGAATNLGYCFGINIANYGGSATVAPGYVGLNGLNAYPGGTSGDFYECARTAPMLGSPANISLLTGGGSLSVNNLFPGCEYRNGAAGDYGSWPNNYYGHTGNPYGDVVGTEEGAACALSVRDIQGNHGNLFWVYRYDTKRQKYSALNAQGLAQYPNCTSPNVNPSCTPPPFYATGANTAPWWDVEEYTVMGTAGSDWFNYTHDWGTATNYNVYLRNACALTESLNLYNGATTNRANQLGTFYCTNSLMWNFRYTPLLDASGKPAVVQLGGNTTLRLEIQPDMPNWVTIERGLALNYLAFVPTNRALLVTNIVVVLSTTNRITSVVNNHNGTFTVNVLGTPGAQYYLVTSGNIKTPLASWTTVVGSSSTASGGGTWSYTVSASGPAYYRSVAVNPHP